MKLIYCLICLVCLSLTACDSGVTTDSEIQNIKGFTLSRLPDDMKRSNIIFIFAPSHCPKEAGQRADALERRLKNEGLSVERRNSFRYESQNMSKKERTEIERTMKILKGKVPIVFVNQYGKANPSYDEVMEIYNATKGD